MKKISISLLLVTLASVSVFAQKYAFVDSDYILSNIPAYKAAQEQLDKLSVDYQNQVKVAQDELEKLYKDYKAEKFLLSDDIRTKREEVIVTKEREVKKMQNDFFGQEGLLFKKREELVKPIQDEVYNALKEIANESGYAVIFDTASGLSMLYTNPRYDISDEVLKRLGYKN